MGLLKGADIAIDLGTASVLVYVNKEGIEEYKCFVKNILHPLRNVKYF